MPDNLYDIFENINKIDPFGPTQTREMKVEVVNGEERIAQITRIEKEIDGVMNVLEEVRYLCQGCGVEWVTPGLDGFSQNKRVLCKKCSKKAKIKSFLKPFWGPFVKFDENK
jgi:hypothetical protein